MSLLESEKQIIERLDRIERLLLQLLEAKLFDSIEELSLGKTCKLLHKGSESVIQLVKDGRLKAITYRDKNRIERFRFRVSDIREYQNSMVKITERKIEEMETVDEMIDRIFHRVPKKKMLHKRK